MGNIASVAEHQQWTEAGIQAAGLQHLRTFCGSLLPVQRGSRTHICQSHQRVQAGRHSNSTKPSAQVPSGMVQFAACVHLGSAAPCMPGCLFCIPVPLPHAQQPLLLRHMLQLLALLGLHFSSSCKMTSRCGGAATKCTDMEK